MHPTEGAAPGQRLQQRDDAVCGDEVHDHQVHRERGQVGAVPDRPGPRPVGPLSGVDLPAAAFHLVLVVLGDLHGDLRDLVLLVAVHDPQITGTA